MQKIAPSMDPFQSFFFQTLIGVETETQGLFLMVILNLIARGDRSDAPNNTSHEEQQIDEPSMQGSVMNLKGKE